MRGNEARRVFSLLLQVFTPVAQFGGGSLKPCLFFSICGGIDAKLVPAGRKSHFVAPCVSGSRNLGNAARRLSDSSFSLSSQMDTINVQMDIKMQPHNNNIQKLVTCTPTCITTL